MRPITQETKNLHTSSSRFGLFIFSEDFLDGDVKTGCSENLTILISKQKGPSANEMQLALSGFW